MKQLLHILYALALAVVVALVIVLAFLHGLAQGAPAPRPRPSRITAAAITGGWNLTWNDIQAPCALLEGGRWWCWWSAEWEGNPEAWHGTWELKGDLLTVKEWPACDEGIDGTPPAWHYEWSVKLVEVPILDMYLGKKPEKRKRPLRLDGKGESEDEDLATTWRREK